MINLGKTKKVITRKLSENLLWTKEYTKTNYEFPDYDVFSQINPIYNLGFYFVEAIFK